MLKLIYTEAAFHLERLTHSPEQIVAQRATLAMRVGESICIEPSSAAFLLPRNLPAIALLEETVQNRNSDAIALCVADEDSLEVSLTGTWISADYAEDHGIFVTVLSDRAERLLEQLWRQTYAGASVRE
ncbi:alr0857 family protein [Lyngbya sp. CCY1209]|jgi:hypothetical protein|uniref:alr0857 family protein n=1 Tax=Lyngbya sp. CCY1209 TaxID=2886103 RepID=UPI002D20857B|nr:alr0857 family protein [Lyngbya sp. CCY1209]MEB3886986.1 hypothetical protein [Lyngbya sp. CCY1209]